MKYLFKILLIVIFIFYSLSLASKEENKNKKESFNQSVHNKKVQHKIPDELSGKGILQHPFYSFWLGGGFGFSFVERDIHDHLVLFLTLHGKTVFDVTPVKWLNFEFETDMMWSVNFFWSPSFVYRFSGGLLPGYIFKSDDALYMISAGIFYNYFLYKDRSAGDIGYRVKVSFIPFINDIIDFPKVRGYIECDYSYAEDSSGFQMGGLGIQVGSEFYIF